MPQTAALSPVLSAPAPMATGRRAKARLPRAAVPGLGLAVLLGLTGCGQSDQKFAPLCPQLKLLADGGDLTRMRGQGTDLTDLEIKARIAGVNASCSEGKGGSINATLQVVMDATRGPASAVRSVDLPYLVTVTANGQPIDQKLFVAPVAFPANADRGSAAGEELALNFPISAERPVTAYAIYVSFRLTAAELAYNRRMKR